MSLQVEKLEKNMAKLTIEVSADELEKALQNAYKKQKNKISMPCLLYTSIVTSYVFRDGKINWENMEKLKHAVGKENVVIDLSLSLIHIYVQVCQ